MVCNECRHLGTEDAGRGRTFYKCGANGRVLESVPNGRTAEVMIPAWCEGAGAADAPMVVTALKRVKPEWK